MVSTLSFEGIVAVVGPWFEIAFTLTAGRISAMFIATPIFATPLVPNQAKIGLVATRGILALSTTSPSLALMTLTPLQLATAMFAELVLGGVMGMGLMILFAALAFAGQLVGIQMGFAIANVVDPISSRQVGVLAQVLNLFGPRVVFGT